MAAVAALAAVVPLSSLALVADRTHFFTDAVGAVCLGAGVTLARLGRRRAPGRRPAESRNSYPGGEEKA